VCTTDNIKSTQNFSYSVDSVLVGVRQETIAEYQASRSRVQVKEAAYGELADKSIRHVALPVIIYSRHRVHEPGRENIFYCLVECNLQLKITYSL